jgi:hypothetical protein
MRFRIVILAQMAAGMGADCVKIAQAGGTHTMDLVRPGENPLDHELGLAVRAARIDLGNPDKEFSRD